MATCALWWRQPVNKIFIFFALLRIRVYTYQTYNNLKGSNSQGKEYKMICYYTNWAQYRPGKAKFLPENIDVNLCTHVIIAFAKVEAGLIKTYEWNDDEMYRRVNALKKQKPSLRTMIAIGGWTAGSSPFTTVVNSVASRKRFIYHALKFLRQFEMDGLDLDWEYPAHRGSPPVDKFRYTQWVKELRLAFAMEARRSRRPRLLLSAAVAAGYTTVDNGYEVRKIAKYMDFINLMSYDLHGSWDSTTGINAPLYARKDESKWHAGRLNQDYAVSKWLNMGTPPDKLIMGIPLYGRTFKLCDDRDNGIGAKACGAGKGGEYTRSAGFLAFYEICKNLKQGWGRHWNEEHKAPYAFKRNQWVGYDDVQSVTYKSRYIVDRGLGGAMVWALDLDDFNNICVTGLNYPLLRTIKAVLGKPSGENNGIIIPYKTRQRQYEAKPTEPPNNIAPLALPLTQIEPKSAKESPPDPWTISQQVNEKSAPSSTTSECFPACRENRQDGQFYCNPSNPESYYICNHGLPQLMNCAGGLHFNYKLRICDWPHAVAKCSCSAPKRLDTSTSPSSIFRPHQHLPQSPLRTPIRPMPRFVPRPIRGPNVVRLYNRKMAQLPRRTIPLSWQQQMAGLRLQAMRRDNNGRSKNVFRCNTAFGFFPDASDCRKFYVCVWRQPYRYVCPAGTAWNDRQRTCDFVAHISCDSNFNRLIDKYKI